MVFRLQVIRKAANVFLAARTVKALNSKPDYRSSCIYPYPAGNNKRRRAGAAQIIASFPDHS